ncbi:hypothetical protein V8C44DRAFT_323084 [Trichoderma aethiopicum]
MLSFSLRVSPLFCCLQAKRQDGLHKEGEGEERKRKNIREPTMSGQHPGSRVERREISGGSLGVGATGSSMRLQGQRVQWVRWFASRALGASVLWALWGRYGSPTEHSMELPGS